jgi:dTDP-glucose 4,6-dehydratase
MHKRKVNNLLVTGGAGFIGSAFIRYLLSETVNFQGVCINLDALTYAGNLENLPDLDDDYRYHFVSGDIRNPILIESICHEYSIDTIIHFAAESHVDRSIAEPLNFIETNVVGTLQLLEVVRKNKHIHFHHVSTDEVYGTLGEEGYFNEASPYKPSSPYSASKAASDHLVRAYGHTYQISYCISNCSNNFGPCQFPEKFVPLMILNCLEGLPLPIYGKGTNVRDWLYVNDHAEALLLLLERGRSGETYNIGGGAEWKNIDLVHKIIDATAFFLKKDANELKKLITFVQDRPGHDLRYAIDSYKIQHELNWKPKHTFQTALNDTISWYISNPHWIRNVNFVH